MTADDWRSWPRCLTCKRPLWQQNMENHRAVCKRWRKGGCPEFGCGRRPQGDDGMCERHTREPWEGVLAR